MLSCQKSALQSHLSCLLLHVLLFFFFSFFRFTQSLSTPTSVCSVASANLNRLRPKDLFPSSEKSKTASISNQHRFKYESVSAHFNQQRNRRLLFTFTFGLGRGRSQGFFHNYCSSDRIPLSQGPKLFAEEKFKCTIHPFFRVLSFPLSTDDSTKKSTLFTRSSSSLLTMRNQKDGEDLKAEEVINDLESGKSNKENHVLLIIPGYASDADQYKNLRKALRKQGLKAEIAPIKWNMWIPTFGGRSIRPILDRITSAVKEVSRSGLLQSQDAEYNVSDFMREMKTPSIGASPASKYDPYRDLTIDNGSIDGVNLNFEKMKTSGRMEEENSNDNNKLQDEKNYKVTLIAHSAGGWISRVFLSTTPYDGVVYNGTRWVDALVTLGSPHVFPKMYSDKPVESIPFALRNLKFVNDKCVGEHGGHWEEKVKCICVGGDTVKGKKYYGFKDIVYQSYELCGQEGHETGDGITPLTSSLGLPGAKQVTIKNVMHGPEADHYGKKWYGSEDILPLWINYLDH